MQFNHVRASRYFTIVVIFLALCWQSVAPSASVLSQEQKDRKAQTEPVVRIETELVQLDLVVADKDGKLVSGLRREDFQLLEDGKPQAITHFAVGTAARPAAWLRTEKKNSTKETAPAAPVAEINAGRYLVLAVDDFHIAPENLLQAKRTLLRFLSEQLVSGDQVAVVTTSGNVGLFQQFTSERPVLERAINRLNVQTRSTGADKSTDVPRISDYQAELIDLGDYDALQLAVEEIMRQQGMSASSSSSGGGRNTGGRSGGGGGAVGYSPLDLAKFTAQSKARAIVAENAHFTQATLATLEQIIRSLRPLTGRKMIVLLSDGFFLGGARNSKHYDLRRLTDAATRAGVVIYSLDTRGLVAAPPGGDASKPGTFNPALPGAAARIENQALDAARDGLNALAYDTGGFMVVNTNDLNAGLQRVLNDNETYYVLAYEPEKPYRDGRFHQIEIRVAGRPELKVRSRKGYYAPSEKELAKAATAAAKNKAKEQSSAKAVQETRAAEVRTGLASLFPLREIPVELAADFLDTPQEGSAVVVNAVIKAAALNLEQADSKHRGALDVALVVFDEQGRTAFNTSNRVNLNLTTDSLKQLAEQGLAYRRLVPLKPGFYQVRMAVREDGSARLGSAAQWVEIPDLSKKQLTLSSVVLSSSAAPLTLPAADSAAEQRPLQIAHRFKRNSSADFLIFTYNATVQGNTTDLVIQAQVYAGSKLIYATPLVKLETAGQPDLQRLPYAARLSLAAFEPGEYELRLVVIDRLVKKTALRRVNFTVE